MNILTFNSNSLLFFSVYSFLKRSVNIFTHCFEFQKYSCLKQLRVHFQNKIIRKKFLFEKLNVMF